MHVSCYQETLASSGYKSQRRNQIEGEENRHKRKTERGRVEGREEERHEIAQRKIQEKRVKKKNEAMPNKETGTEEQRKRNRTVKQRTQIGEEVSITTGFLSPKPGMLMSFLRNN
ncbi:hypothetical protein NC651_000900 [Populus alba x Populus x berolinensis]|uniref:Uncharacterized protein n=1 Tax=Populus alba x Populus x berolinensis TaxID=444605 RepID=A0AAD6RJX4_9ROSI|nr:hypothetical protein NC651_000900 [Populus alba x Populus x berolinensis]KAJ7010379.1 hypothetical protein NC653_000966 [Populus alba x Populus x berolinensis]